MILLLMLTDGRADCFARTLESAERMLPAGDGWWPITRRVIHDDSGDPAYARWLAEQAPGFEIISAPGRSGFGGAIRNAWAHLCATADRDTCDYVLHLEDDFTFNRPTPLDAMAGLLRAHPHLVQVALRRQAWSDDERAAGGLIEAHPDWYTERRRGRGQVWLEQTAFFTTNPCLYRRSLCWRGWPEGDQSEGRFTAQLRAEQPGARFGYWGARDSGEWVHHIGEERVGMGY